MLSEERISTLMADHSTWTLELGYAISGEEVVKFARAVEAAALRAQADAQPVAWRAVGDGLPAERDAILVTNNRATCESRGGTTNMWLVGGIFKSGDSYEAFSDAGHRIENISHWRYALTPHPAPEAAQALSDEEDLADAVSKAMRRAWNLGQTYWQQADSEYSSQWKKADKTQAEYQALVDETRAAILTRASDATVAEPSAGEEIHVNVQGDDVYTLPLQPTGMETPRFVVHVPAAEEAPNRRADELEAFKAYNPLGYKQMDGLLVWRAACAWQRAAQQQAEPTQCDPMVANEDGWCDWQFPIHRGYKMQCCDCGLVHDVEFDVVKIVEHRPDGTWRSVDVDDPDYRVALRMKRETPQQAEPGADERAAQSVNELPRVANSLGGFRGGFIGVHGRAPTEQEIWNGGVRSGLDRAAQSGQQQAEPGADERAEFEAAYRNGCAEVTMRRNRDGRYEHDVQNVAWQIWQRARVAQSGQRAGVVEGTKLWLWKNGDHYLAYRHLYPCYEPGGDPMTLGEPVGYAEFRESHDRAAAPTQQQEGGS